MSKSKTTKAGLSYLCVRCDKWVKHQDSVHAACPGDKDGKKYRWHLECIQEQLREEPVQIKNPPLKYYGGKWYLQDKIHAHAPPMGSYITRLIPYGGALGEFWNWDCEGVSEIVNDIDFRLANLWRCIRDPDLFDAFSRQVSCMPFSRAIFDEAVDYMTRWKDRRHVASAPSPLLAAMFFVLVRQSLGGRCSTFGSISINRTRRNMNEQASAWWSSIEGLPEVHSRMARVVVENLDAIELLKHYDDKKTFAYLDPTYLPETRKSKSVYEYEMSREEHEELLAVLHTLKMKIMISGYDNELYNKELTLKGWRKNTFDVSEHAGSGKIKGRRVEVIWTNYDPPKSQ